MLVGGIISVIAFTVLANLGGNSEPLKQSIEDYLTETTGYEAQVGKLNSMNFFPMIIIDFENLNLNGENGTASADKVYMGARFWDVMFRTGKIKAIEVKGFRAASGIVMEKEFAIDYLGISPVDENNALLIGEGAIDKAPFTIREEIEAFGATPYQLFRFPEGMTINLRQQDGTIIPLEMQDGLLVIQR